MSFDRSIYSCTVGNIEMTHNSTANVTHIVIWDDAEDKSRGSSQISLWDDDMDNLIELCRQVSKSHP